MKKYFKKKHKAMVSANQHICKRKISYPSSIDAWNGAEYYYITEGTVSSADKCCACQEYHRTSKTSIGDMTHIPEQFRELFQTFNQESEGVPFITRLRERLI